MSSKGKKSSSLWYACETCSCVISNKDLQEHQLSCTGDKISDWKLPFIKNEVLYGFIEESKLTGELTVNTLFDAFYLSNSKYRT